MTLLLSIIQFLEIFFTRKFIWQVILQDIGIKLFCALTVILEQTIKLFCALTVTLEQTIQLFCALTVILKQTQKTLWTIIWKAAHLETCHQIRIPAFIVTKNFIV